MNISGGTVGDNFDAGLRSVINITGREFFIDGVEINGLVLDEPLTITDRNVTLSGLLADGQPFSFDLNAVNTAGNDSLDPEATLTVTLDSPVFMLGDVNRDDAVNFLDIAPFIEVLSNNGFQLEADVDQNEVVNFFDIPRFIELLSGQ